MCPTAGKFWGLGCGNEGTKGTYSGVLRWCGLGNDATNDRVDTVGADHDVCLRCPTVGEQQSNALIVGCDADTSRIKLNISRWHRCANHVQQIRSVDRVRMLAIQAFASTVEHLNRDDSAVLPATELPTGVHPNRGLLELIHHTEPSNQSGGVGSDHQPSADLFKFGGLLVDRR
jgi:hypothetical protein